MISHVNGNGNKRWPIRCWSKDANGRFAGLSSVRLSIVRPFKVVHELGFTEESGCGRIEEKAVVHSVRR